MKNMFKVLLIVGVLLGAVPGDIYANVHEFLFRDFAGTNDDSFQTSNSMYDMDTIGDFNDATGHFVAFDDTSYLHRNNARHNRNRSSELFNQDISTQQEKIISVPKTGLDGGTIAIIATGAAIVIWVAYVFATWDDDKGRHNFCTVGCTYKK